MVAGLWLLGLGCGGTERVAQTPAEVQVFCDKYEENFIGDCRQNCESGLSPGDTAGTKACIKKCQADLGSDSTFKDDCPHRAPLYAEAGAK